MRTLAVMVAGVAVLAWGVAAARERNDAGEVSMTVFDPTEVEATVRALVARHGAGLEPRIRQGVTQAATFWRDADGDPEAFRALCLEQFVADPDRRRELLARFESNLEAVTGHQVALTRHLREASDLDLGEPLPVDLLFATLNPFDHFSEDAFRTRVAFSALLNFRIFPQESLAGLPRADWAEARLTQGFSQRIPGEARAKETAAFAAADDYIAGYNIHLDDLRTADGQRPFAGGPRLISHWGLRDHIKALYVQSVKNLPLQRLILRVMERIVRQEIPAAVIDRAGVDWDPVGNVVTARKAGEADPPATREDDRRYAWLLQVFRAEQAVDRWSPVYPTYIDRKFRLEREIPEARARALLESVLTDPVAKKVARVIRKRLGRDLEPFDIWYDGFKARSRVAPEELDAKVRARYPSATAFQTDLPTLLGRLGFDDDTARFLADRIVVDPARGAGHAMGAGMRSDRAHLRTRVPREGMDYKGYNIAIHELGHCVEQVLSLDRVDHTLLAGVPNTAFTEAMAFAFQDRDLEILGIAGEDEKTRALKAVDAFWMTFEISGVAVLDMTVWHWMYDHPDATPGQLREAVVRNAVEIWNRFYAPVLGVKDSPILAIYSHMISSGLYLPDYPIGHIVQAQVETRFHGLDLGREMERMVVQGRLTPDEWMKGAVGQALSSQALIDAARAGLKAL